MLGHYKKRYIGVVTLFFLLLSLKSQSQFIINGSANLVSQGEYQLTAAQGGKVGTIWSEQKVSLADPFEVELELYFGTKDANGADGITFSLQPKSNTLGVSGGGLGIGGITPSLITEMDTYRNGAYGDPSYDHIALVKNTVDHRGRDNLVAPQQIVAGKDNVEDGAWYNFKAVWDPVNQVFQVSINGTQRFSYEADIVNDIFDGDPNVYWGFTASTGGLNNDQRVRVINTTFIDLYTCTETPNDKTFCDAVGPVAVNLDFANDQAGATYEWYDTPTKDNLLGTGLTYTTNPISENTDYYVLATFAGGVTTATVGPVPSGTLADIFDVNYMAGYDRNFTILSPATIKSVDMNHPAYQGGCGAPGTTRLAEVDVYQGGSIVATKVINAVCGQTATIPLDFNLNTGSYRMEVRGIAGGQFKVNSDGSEKEIPGVIRLESNDIAGPGGSLSYSSVFFNWEIEGGIGTSECLFSVKAEKDCPPCATFPIVSIGTGFTYCSENDTTIEVTTSASNVLWSTNETTNQITVSEGTYTVEVWDDPNCPSYDNIIVNKECPAEPVELLLDTMEICSGVTDTIFASNVEFVDWSGTDVFTPINDSMVSINLTSDATYYVTNYIRLNIVSENIDFEDPRITSNFSQMDAGLVPGWETTAPDNEMEIWKSGFLGVPAYKGEQFIEINSSFDAALFQEMNTIPGEVIGINLAHRGRTGPDEIRLLAGPPSGPFTVIDNYLDGNTAWGFYTEYYTVPAGQTETRFMFETVSCNGGPCTGSGNFLDAIEFFRVEEQTDSIYVKVTQTPVFALGNDTTICGDIALTLDAGNPGYNYTWSTTENTQTINITNDGTYSVEVERNGCTDMGDITISQGAAIDLELGNDTSICFGESLVFDAGNTGATFSWSTGASSQTLNASTTGEYFVQVSNSDGCIEGDTINLTILPLPNVNLGNDTTICNGSQLVLDAQNVGFMYDWSTLESSQSINVSQAGAYGVRVHSSGCEDFDTISVTVQSNPVVDLGADTEICFGDIYNLDAGNSALTIVWSTNEITNTIDVSTQGNYSVIVTDSMGCIGSDDFYLTVNPIPTVSISVNENNCLGDGLIDIQMFPPGGNLYGLGLQGDSFNSNDNSLLNLSNNWLKYVYTDQNNCINSDSAIVYVHPVPKATQNTLNLEFCSGKQGALSISSSNAVTLEWYRLGNTKIVEIGDNYDATSSGNYYVKALNDYCSSYSDTVNVNIVVPHIEISSSANLVDEDNRVNLYVDDVDEKATYSWSSIESNVISSNLKNTEMYSYPIEESVYTVEAIFINDPSCVAYAEIPVDVRKVPLPDQVFTPGNGDNTNEFWRIQYLNPKHYPNNTVKVYNKYGNLVFEGHKYDYDGELDEERSLVRWDGRNNEALLPVSTYYYFIELNDSNNTILDGSVSVIR